MSDAKMAEGDSSPKKHVMTPLSQTDKACASSPMDELREFLRAVHIMKLYAASEGLAIAEETRRILANLAHVEEKVAAAVALSVEKGAIMAPDLDLRAALRESMKAHAALCKVVAPATPDSILYTQPPTGFLDFMRRQSILFNLMTLAILAIVGFVGSSIAKTRNDEKTAGPRAIIASVGEFQGRVRELDALLVETPELLPESAKAVEALEKLSNEIDSSSSAIPLLAGTWPDEVVIYALTDIHDRPTGASASIARVVEEVERFRARVEPLSKRPAGSTAVWDHLANLSAAMLGAAFYTLYTANRYIVERTFDRTYTTHYIVRFVLGIVAGVILANFGEYVLDKVTSPTESALTLTQTLLALVGGYSADAVNAVFTRVAETMTTLVRGSATARTREEADAAVRKAEAEGQQQLEEAKHQERVRLMEVLEQARKALAPTTLISEIEEKVRKLGSEG